MIAKVYIQLLDIRHDSFNMTVDRHFVNMCNHLIDIRDMIVNGSNQLIDQFSFIRHDC